MFNTKRYSFLKVVAEQNVSAARLWVTLFFAILHLFTGCKKSVRIAKISIMHLSTSISTEEIKIIPRVRNIGAIQTEGKLFTSCTLFADKEVKSESVLSFLSLTPGESTEIAPVFFKDISVPKNTRFHCHLVASSDSADGTIENSPMEGTLESP